MSVPDFFSIDCLITYYFYCSMNIRQNSELREQLATANQLAQFHSVVAKVQAKYEPYHAGNVTYEQEEVELAGATEEVIW